MFVALKNINASFWYSHKRDTQAEQVIQTVIINGKAA